MNKKKTSPFVYQNIYPNLRHFMSLGRKSYHTYMKFSNLFNKRNQTSGLPLNYSVCNTSTINSDITLKTLEGSYPNDINGSLYITQCLGVPEAFMVGDTNIVKMDFDEKSVKMKNRVMWTPAALARLNLKKSKHRFDYFGLMYLSPGLGMYSYTEGMYLLPDGRLAVTSDVDRPWIIDPKTLKSITPIGKRTEWLPMMAGKAGEVMGNLFAGYSNSHVMYTDFETDEVFFTSYQYKQQDGTHPVNLIKWDGYNDFQEWLVLDENGNQIEILQSIHELVFTRDYILLADTAFVAGTEMLTPWVNAPLPYEKTVMYIIDRRDLNENKTVTAKRVEVDEPCIHLIPEYENPNNEITVYKLHTPATNTAEIIKSYDKDLDGNLFHENMIGYGTLPVLDLSSVGKHVINVSTEEVVESKYIRETPFTWGPYLYTYMGRQLRPLKDQDLFVMFKGFNKKHLPKRIHDAYKDVENRKLSLNIMVDGDGLAHNNSICRIDKSSFEITDSYVFSDDTLLYTITCLESKNPKNEGYILAGVVTDSESSKHSSGHEYWLFDAENLGDGPLCKLGDESLNNSTLFHTVYMTEDQIKHFDSKKKNYKINLREDYPKEELLNWDETVLNTFDEIIWPYYDKEISVGLERKIEELKSNSVESHFGKEYLIGEERVSNHHDFANHMFKEVNRMLKTTGWKTEKEDKYLKVQSKPISGPLESSNILITRATGIIDANAKETFEMLTSPAGYAVIDPISKPEDHKLPPLEVYDWKENGRLEAAVATVNIKALPKTEFVVLNAIDYDTLTFASKSIIHDQSPGGSKYSTEAAPVSGKGRALNTFAVKIEEISESKCRVSCINYADMAGKTSSGMNNLINTKAFFPPLYKRIRREMSK